MSIEEQQVLSLWYELKDLVEILELDVVKSTNGVAAAGVRARKGLRDLKSKIEVLVKVTIELGKAKKALRAEKSHGDTPPET